MASGTQGNEDETGTGGSDRRRGRRERPAAVPSTGETVRVDSWIWSVRLVKTRSMGATACRGGHVRVNGERVKPAYAVRVGDEVRCGTEGRERVVIVKRVIRKRVGAPVAARVLRRQQSAAAAPRGRRPGGCPRPRRGPADQAGPPRAGTSARAWARPRASRGRDARDADHGGAVRRVRGRLRLLRPRWGPNPKGGTASAGRMSPDATAYGAPWSGPSSDQPQQIRRSVPAGPRR